MVYVSLGILLIMISLLIWGGYHQYRITNLEEKKYLPPGKMIDVGGYSLHINKLGPNVGPTVIIDAGRGCNAIGWTFIQAKLAQFVQVCTYDRAGLGWSDVSPATRTSENIVTELHTLLNNAQAHQPYILIGHSFGGINMLLYALRYPKEVAGVIVVDSCHEDQLDKLPKNLFFSIKKFLTHPRVKLLGAYVGLPRLFPTLVDDLPGFPEHLVRLSQAKDATIKRSRAFCQEYVNFSRSVLPLKNSDKNYLDNKPLTVISASSPVKNKGSIFTKTFYEKWSFAWKILQKDLTKKSKRGEQVIAENSGHMVHLDAPETIIYAVQKIIDNTTR